MSSRQTTGRRDGVSARTLAAAGVLIAVLALVISMSGVAEAVLNPKPSTTPKRNGLLLLGKNKKFPARAIPKVRSAKNADRFANRKISAFAETCAADSVDVGTFCIMSNTYPLLPEDEGKNNYFYASQKCAAIGGYVPSAEMLIGAVDRIKISSVIDDNPVTASIDEDPTDGLKDRREMSSTLVTTAAGATASGTQGVTSGSKGNPQTGEPDPVPLPANPQPETLQYVTVYDNYDKGGFAGSKPVSQPERFRCAFNKQQARYQRKIEE